MKVPEFFYNVNFFSDKELKSFESFLMSPIYNTMKSQLLVYRIIKNNITYVHNNYFEDLKLLIIKESKYTEATIRKVLSYLNEKCIKFSKLQAHKEDKYQNEYLLCNYLLLKGNYKLLEKRTEHLNKILNDEKQRDQNLFLKLYNLNKLKYDTLTTSEEKLNPEIKLNKQIEYTLEAVKDLLVHTVSLTTLEYVNYVVQCYYDNKNTNKKFSVDLDILYSAANTPEYNAFSKFQMTTVNIFEKIYRLFENPTQDNLYIDYKKYFKRVSNMYNPEFEKLNLGIMLLFCSLRHHLFGKNKYYKKESLKIQSLYINGFHYINENTEYLSSIVYRNFIISCTQDLKGLLKEFIENHTSKLHPSETETMENYGWAHFYYLDKNFSLAIEYAKKLKSPKYFYRYDIFNLLIKSNYETGNMEEVMDLLHNYEKYTKKDTILTGNDKDRYNFLVSKMNKFIRARFKYDKKGKISNIEYILSLIEAKKSFVMKNWLTEKVKLFIDSHYKKIPDKRIVKKFKKQSKQNQ
ncbi:MAG: hypothetical protein ACOYN6_10235 [Ignavibacteria bacterium]